MKSFHLCDDPDITGNYIWIVSDYQSGSYEGSGQAVALTTDGNLLVWESLSHCSCYGPDECTFDTYSIEEFLRNKDCVHDLHLQDNITSKVKELLECN